MNENLTAAMLWGFMAAIVISRLIPGALPPWRDIDALIYRTANLFGDHVIGRKEPINANYWAASYESRIVLLKQMSLGILLLLILPYHKVSKSDWIIDYLWKIIEAGRQALVTIFASGRLQATHSWREAEYELWEVFVVVWTISFFLEIAFQEQARLPEHLKPAAFANMMRRFSKFEDLILLVGVVVMVLLDNPYLRICFELLVVILMSVLDVYYARKYEAHGIHHSAAAARQLLILADIPAVLAFLGLLLFLLLNHSNLQSSDWIPPFVSGASALNLLLASCTTFMLKVIHAYNEAAATEQVHIIGNGANGLL